MTTFIELTSPTSSVIKWTVSTAHIIMVRRVGHDDECQIQLVSGQITPREGYSEVQALLRGEPIA